jgi:hypothetical protein
LNHDRNRHELEWGHSMELVCLKSFVLHQFKFWVMGVF